MIWATRTRLHAVDGEQLHSIASACGRNPDDEASYRIDARGNGSVGPRRVSLSAKRSGEHTREFSASWARSTAIDFAAPSWTRRHEELGAQVLLS